MSENIHEKKGTTNDINNNEIPKQKELSEELIEKIYPYALKQLLKHNWEFLPVNLCVVNYCDENSLKYPAPYEEWLMYLLRDKMMNEGILNYSCEVIKTKNEIIKIAKDMGIDLSTEETELEQEDPVEQGDFELGEQEDEKYYNDLIEKIYPYALKKIATAKGHYFCVPAFSTIHNYCSINHIYISKEKKHHLEILLREKMEKEGITVYGKIIKEKDELIKILKDMEINISTEKQELALEEPKEESAQKEQKKYKITIGTSGKIEIDGKVIKISLRTIKNGASMNKLKDTHCIFDILKKENYSPTVVQMIDYGIMVNRFIPIDFTVIHSVFKSKINEYDKKEIIESYLKRILKSEYEYWNKVCPKVARSIKKYENIETDNNLEVIYDMKDLSKPSPFIGILLLRHPENRYLNGEEKEKIIFCANKAYRYGVGKTIGQYEYNHESIFEKILRKFKGNRNLVLNSKKTKLIPNPENIKTIDYTKNKISDIKIDKDELNAVYYYNDLRYSRSIKETIRIYYKYHNFGESTFNKLEELINSQESEEEINR